MVILLSGGYAAGWLDADDQAASGATMPAAPNRKETKRPRLGTEYDGAEDSEASTWQHQTCPAGSERSEHRESKYTEPGGKDDGQSESSNAPTRWWPQFAQGDSSTCRKDESYNSPGKNAWDHRWTDRSSGNGCSDWNNKHGGSLVINIVYGPTNKKVLGVKPLLKTKEEEYQTFDQFKKCYIKFMLKQDFNNFKKEKITTSDLVVVVADKKKHHWEKIADDEDIMNNKADVYIWPKNDWTERDFLIRQHWQQLPRQHWQRQD